MLAAPACRDWSTRPLMCITGVLPASAIFMGVYEPIKQHVEKRVPHNRQFLASLSGGLGAGLVASIVRVPTEVVKQRMQNGVPWLDPFSTTSSPSLSALTSVQAREAVSTEQHCC